MLSIRIAMKILPICRSFRLFPSRQQHLPSTQGGVAHHVVQRLTLGQGHQIGCSLTSPEKLWNKRKPMVLSRSSPWRIVDFTQKPEKCGVSLIEAWQIWGFNIKSTIKRMNLMTKHGSPRVTPFGIWDLRPISEDRILRSLKAPTSLSWLRSRLSRGYRLWQI